VLGPAQCDTIGTRPDINILVNVAGFVHHGTILECPPRRSRSFDLNVGSIPDDSLRPAAHDRARQWNDRQRVVECLEHQGHPMHCVYGASKAAVIGLTKSIAADFVGEHPLQCDLPRHRRFPCSRGGYASAISKPRGGVHGAAADAAAGEARRSGGAGSLSWRRRIDFTTGTTPS
jgi:hypothetical protein